MVISPATAVVGAYGRANLAGRAYLFDQTGGVGKRPPELKGCKTTVGACLGVSVAISGTTAVTGAYMTGFQT